MVEAHIHQLIRREEQFLKQRWQEWNSKTQSALQALQRMVDSNLEELTEVSAMHLYDLAVQFQSAKVLRDKYCPQTHYIPLCFCEGRAILSTSASTTYNEILDEVLAGRTSSEIVRSSFEMTFLPEWFSSNITDSITDYKIWCEEVIKTFYVKYPFLTSSPCFGSLGDAREDIMHAMQSSSRSPISYTIWVLYKQKV